MALEQKEVAQVINDALMPAWRKEKRKLDRIDRWARWDHGLPHRPRQATAEYRELASRAQAPWGDLIVGSVAQTLYVEGYRRPDKPDDSTGWAIWQANGMDARQIAIHRASLQYGIAYGLAMPGKTLSGEKMAQLRGVSPREMIALYADVAMDEWPEYALRVTKTRKGQIIRLYDDTNEWMTEVTIGGSIGDGLTNKEHGAGCCPVVRFANRFDLEGRNSGEIEPFIPLLGRVDQTTFDRLVVQRFASWIVRTIAGMSVNESAEAAGTTADTLAMSLKVNDLLTSPDKDTKFGSLPATPLDGFISAHDADLRDLAAVSQTPAFELLGSLANLSADALAAAKGSQTAKSDERKHVFGETHEQFLRLGCHLNGDTGGADDFLSQVRWADTSVRSIAQAADAYGKIATMLGFPPELLWQKLPGITQQDVEEAKTIIEKGGSVEQLLERVIQSAQPAAA